jgi:septal ring-binding cell division protein DamX
VIVWFAPRKALGIALGAIVLAAALPAARGAAQPATLIARVQQLVNSGNRAAARAVADSALAEAPVGSLVYADALFARAFASADAAAAERDYTRLTIEYPQSPRSEEALLASGQFRMARGDRTGARRQFDRLTLEFPNSANAARAAFWSGRLALEAGDIAKGCAQLGFAQERAGEDIEFRNQIEYVRARCRVVTAAKPADSAASDSGRRLPSGTGEGRAESRTEYSVQVAAYQRQRDAEASARRLRTRGFPVRVVGERAPFRVRVGRYATRELAAAAAARMKKARVNGIVVEAEPR